MNFFVSQDAWLSALVFAGLMLVGWVVGSTTRRFAGERPASSTRIEDGGLALFGLLLAFCFSGAAGRYETRKELLRDDVIAIGDFAAVASALEGPDRQNLEQEIQHYVQLRLVYGRTGLGDPTMAQVIKDGRDSQSRMLTLIGHVVESKNTPSIHAPLFNAFNGLTAVHDKRLYALRDHVNGSIVLMLVVFGVFTTFTMGRLHDRPDKGSLLRIGSYIVLVTIVYFVTVDLEQPRRGLIRVSQLPMQELSESLRAQSP